MKIYVITICTVFYLIFGVLSTLLPSLYQIMPEVNLVLGKHSLDYPLSFINNNLMHGGLLHLLMNMIVVYQFGNIIENVYNKKEQIFLYFISGIVISIVMYVYITNLNPSYNVLGYSGIACCLIGASFKYLSPENRNMLLIQIIIFHVLIIVLNLPISWESHLVGGIIGYLYSNNRFIENKNLSKKKKFKIIK